MRGNVYKLPARRDAQGHEQRGQRYVVVIQSSNLPLSTVVVAPTSTKALPTGFRPEVEIDGRKTFVLPEQMRAVDAEFLGDFSGRLSLAEMQRIDEAVRVVLDLL